MKYIIKTTFHQISLGDMAIGESKKINVKLRRYLNDKTKESVFKKNNRAFVDRNSEVFYGPTLYGRNISWLSSDTSDSDYGIIVVVSENNSWSYEGQIKEGKPHGYGTKAWYPWKPNRTKCSYKGWWENGNYSNWGEHKAHDGIIRETHWSNGKPTIGANISEKHPNGDIYQGTIGYVRNKRGNRINTYMDRSIDDLVLIKKDKWKKMFYEIKTNERVCFVLFVSLILFVFVNFGKNFVDFVKILFLPWIIVVSYTEMVFQPRSFAQALLSTVSFMLYIGFVGCYVLAPFINAIQKYLAIPRYRFQWWQFWR
jgi:hypothetical protein